MELPIELLIVLLSLVGGFCYILGSAISPRTKNLKNEIKYLEGKLYKKKQELKQEIEEKNDNFDLSSLLGGGGLGDILKFVEKNPDVINKLVSSLQTKPKLDDFGGTTLR